MSETMQAAGRGLRGQPVTLADGNTYIIPALNFRQLEHLEPQLAKLTRPHVGMSSEQRDDMLVVLQAALSRNYPEIPREQLLDLIDLEAAMDMYVAIFAVNKLRELLGRVGVASP